MTLEKKLELALWLCNHNHQIALTGSMMLYLRWIQREGNTLDNFYLGREPQDLDFIVNVEDDWDDGNIVMPPFIHGEVEVDSKYTGYPVLKRFYYEDVKVEFIEATHYRYTNEYVSKYKEAFNYDNFTEATFIKELYKYRSGQKDIRLALVSDLYAAKLRYIKEDENLEYIDKTKKDLKALDPIIKEVYRNEYKIIIESYLINSWYYSKLDDDEGRKFVESILENTIDNDKREWLKYCKSIDHNYTGYYRKWYRETKDPWYDSYGYTYELQKIIDKLLNEYQIPFEINKIQSLELLLV